MIAVIYSNFQKWLEVEVYIFAVKLSILFDEMKSCKLLTLSDMDMSPNGRIIFRKIWLDSFKLLV